MTSEKQALRLERETCGRCGGSGHYSYNQRHGTMCYGCGGKGERLTARGKAAHEFLIRLRSKKAAELKPGDVIKEDVITLGGDMGACWAEVVEVAPDDATFNPQRVGTLRVETRKCSHHGVAPDALFLCRLSKEQSAATLRQAIEYQATLTKQGKPRKVRGSND